MHCVDLFPIFQMYNHLCVMFDDQTVPFKVADERIIVFSHIFLRHILVTEVSFSQILIREKYNQRYITLAN